MADAGVQLSMTPSKTPSNTFTKATSKVSSKEEESALNLSPTDMAFSAEGRKTKAQTLSMSVPPKTTSVTLNTEVLSVLKELNVNLNKQSNKLEMLAQRVSELYEMDGREPQEGRSEENDENVPEMGKDGSSVQPLKKQCSEIDIFKNLCDKYQATEKCDSEINDNLAAFINDSFRNGVSEETLGVMLKDIHRPSNCEALVKTKVNACMWHLLKPQTQSEDVKFQTMHNILVKATSNLAKQLDKEGFNMDSQSLEWGTNAVALLGQSYKRPFFVTFVRNAHK